MRPLGRPALARRVQEPPFPAKSALYADHKRVNLKSDATYGLRQRHSQVASGLNLPHVMAVTG